jgi:hypothetical protein
LGSDRLTLWKLLHDGDIESIDGRVPGTLRLRVGIQYLRDMFRGSGNGFRVELRGCDLIELESWMDDTAIVRDPEAIGKVGLEISSAEERPDHLLVICSGYDLRLRYQSAHVELDNGMPVTIDELQDAADRFWTEWEKANPERKRPH